MNQRDVKMFSGKVFYGFSTCSDCGSTFVLWYAEWNAFPRILLVYDTTLKANVMKTCNIRFYTSSANLQENIHGNNVSAAKSFPINILDSKALLKIQSEWKKCHQRKKLDLIFLRKWERKTAELKKIQSDVILKVVKASASVNYI